MQLNLSSFSGKSTSAKSLRTQRGDFLIESLIGMVLMAIIGMGVVFVTSQMSVAKKDMRLQEIAVNQMRALLLNNGTRGINICTSTPHVKLPGVPDNDIEVEVIGCSTTTATIAGVTIADVPKPLFISVKSDALGGEVIVGGSGS
jgi:type II secretory pathway pseudopilin PulG